MDNKNMVCIPDFFRVQEVLGEMILKHRHADGTLYTMDDKTAEDTQIFENLPTNGFTLKTQNEDEKCYRCHCFTDHYVHDPRGFDISLPTEDMIYFLRNGCVNEDSLIGDFVYGWYNDGDTVCLIPVAAPDYPDFVKYSELVLHKDILDEDHLIPGAVYASGHRDELIYIGKFPKYTESFVWKDSSGKTRHARKYRNIPLANKVPKADCSCVREKGSSYVFAEAWQYRYANGNVHDAYHFLTYNDIADADLKWCRDKKKNPNYEMLVDRFKTDSDYFPIDYKKTEWSPYEREKFDKVCSSLVMTTKMDPHGYKSLFSEADYKHFFSKNPDLNPHQPYYVGYNCDTEMWTVKDYHETLNILDSADELYKWLQPAHRQTFYVSGKKANFE